MRRTIGFVALSIVLNFLLIQGSLQAQNSATSGGGFSITTLASRGQPSPDGGQFSFSKDRDGQLTHFSLNKRGEVSLEAPTSGPCGRGVFVISPVDPKLIATTCTPTALGLFSSVQPGNLNDVGGVVFRAVDSATGAGGFILYKNGELSKIVYGGDPTPVGTIFRGCGFSEPTINNKGEIAFGSCSDDGQGNFVDGVWGFSNGQLHPILLTGAPSPIGGVLALGFQPSVTAVINERSEVLFEAGVLFDIFTKEKFGLFVTGQDGVKKVVVDGDPLPNDSIVRPGALGIGDLNDLGQVAFTVDVQGPADTGIFLWTDGQISKIIAQGDASPIGGTFLTLGDPDLIELLEFIRPRLNNNGAVLFEAKVKTSDGKRTALFLASTKAILKVAALGDEIAPGVVMKGLGRFSLNDLGQVAFLPYGDKRFREPLGLYLASPRTPEIKSVKLKRKKGGLELRVNGSAMITNDTIIEINGTPITDLSYPEDFRESGGTITRVTSRDARLEQLIPEGQSVQVTVFNSLTNLRSAARTLSR
jgi:hypothetical protein